METSKWELLLYFLSRLKEVSHNKLLLFLFSAKEKTPLKYDLTLRDGKIEIGEELAKDLVFLAKAHLIETTTNTIPSSTTNHDNIKYKVTKYGEYLANRIREDAAKETKENKKIMGINRFINMYISKNEEQLWQKITNL